MLAKGKGAERRWKTKTFNNLYDNDNKIYTLNHSENDEAHKSAEALCLQACRRFEPAPNPPNLQNLKQAHKGEGLPSPYPLPDGPARSTADFP